MISIHHKIMSFKICTHCKNNISIDQFNYVPSAGRLHAKCNPCMKIIKHNYYINNKKAIQIKKEQWRQKTIEHRKKRDAEYHLKNKEMRNQQSKEYYIKNKKKIYEQRAKYRKANKDKVNKLQRDRLKNNPHLRISSALRRRARREIGSGKTYLQLLDCSKDFMFKWFEFNFALDKYLDLTWNNFGKIWEIDHVIPCKFFNMDSDSDKKICFNWKNVVPVDKHYNKIKCSKLKIIDIQRQEIRIRLFCKQNNFTNINYNEFIRPILPRLLRN